MRHALVLSMITFFSLQSLSGQAMGAGGPEALMLVVNSSSESSKEIANHYIRLRKLSPRNVVYIDWRGSKIQTTGTIFRDQILKPILQTIDERKMGAQIEYIVYSADFPFRIDFRKEFEGEGLPQQFVPIASLTGATYLWTYSKELKPSMVMPTVNWYVPADARKNQVTCNSCDGIPTHGFKARTFWQKSGEPTTDRTKGQSYMLSAMLGVTLERGNTVPEILKYFRSASVADGSQPSGTFYFLKNGDVRSKTRHNCYEGVAELLRKEGAKAVVRTEKYPNVKGALGIMAGTSTLKMESSNPAIVPGAICDHLTSSGARFDGQYQSKISEWLRAGAAGSGGTVWEPYTLQAKFPLPIMHLHYRRGTSLAEAFYQSVSCPYQQLLVGDPLCQPWTKSPQVEITNLKPGEKIRGPLKLVTKVVPQPGTQIENCELYLDGRILAAFPPGAPIPISTKTLGRGWHELRVIASTKDAIGYRGRAIVPFFVAKPEESAEPTDAPEAGINGGSPITLQISPAPIVPSGTQINVKVSGPANVPGFTILQNSRVVAYVAGNSGRTTLGIKRLGKGPVRLIAQVAESADSPILPAEQAQRSAPQWILLQ